MVEISIIRINVEINMKHMDPAMIISNLVFSTPHYPITLLI